MQAAVPWLGKLSSFSRVDVASIPPPAGAVHAPMHSVNQHRCAHSAIYPQVQHERRWWLGIGDSAATQLLSQHCTGTPL